MRRLLQSVLAYKQRCNVRLFDVIDKHTRVVLLVDMVARQDHHVFRFITADNVEVLGDRICGAAIPVFPFHSLLCWQQIDKLVHFFIEE